MVPFVYCRIGSFAGGVECPVPQETETVPPFKCKRFFDDNGNDDDDDGDDHGDDVGAVCVCACVCVDGEAGGIRCGCFY